MGFAGGTTFLAVALGISALALSTSSTIYQALLPEIVPREAWGISSGVRGALTLIGTIAGLLVAALLNARWALYTTAACVAIGMLSLLLIPEKLNANGRDDAERHPDAPPDRHDLIVTLIARAFIVLGMTLLNTYILYFFHDVLHVANAPLRTGLTATGALGGAIVSSIAAGLASDRYDRRYIVAGAGIPMTIAGIGFALYPSPDALIGYAVLFGLGFGAVFSVGWALALDSIPEMGDVGRDLGIWATLSGLPAIAAPAMGAFIIKHGETPALGYRWLFITASIAVALGSATVLKVRKKNRGTA
jgi:MFS family permease